MIEYKNFTNECGIYCFTNKVNGKCYVGQAVNLKKRLRSHYSTFRKQNVSNMILYTAVEKYGLENFELDILEYCDPNLSLEELKSLLDEKEKFYIKEKNSYVPNGYNQTLGEDAGVLGYKMTEEQKEKISSGIKKANTRFKKVIYLRNIKEPKYYMGYTYEDAVKKSGVSKSIIQAICNKRYVHPYAKGWTFANDEITLFNNVAEALRNIAKGTYGENSGRFEKGKVQKYSLEHLKSPVILYSEVNIIEKTFSSIKEASEELNISKNSIYKHLNRDGKYCFKNGTYLVFRDVPKRKKMSAETKQKLQNNCPTKKQVIQLSKTGETIYIHDSISAAARFIGTDLKSIKRACKGKVKTCKGFIWKFKEQ